MNVPSLVEKKKNPKIPPLSPGDTVKVSARIVEGGKERIQVFQGVVIQVRPGGNGASFTVRHVAFGIGVERTFPFQSPLVEKVEIVRHGKVRRSKLYYLRNLSGRQARRKIKRVEKKVESIGAELLEAEAEEALEPEEVLGEEGEMIAVADAEAQAEAEEVVEEPAAGEAEEKPEASVESTGEAVEEKPQVTAEPVAEEAVEEPKAEEVTEEPEEVTEPVAEVTEDKPEVAAEPVTEDVVEEPAAEEKPEEAPEAVEEPVAEKEEETKASGEPEEEKSVDEKS
jgi:large subunit ribosomal protein L19